VPEKRSIRISLFTDCHQLVDETSVASRLLTDLCNETGLEPFAVLTSALVLLKMRAKE
jgi:hypothetical protein